MKHTILIVEDDARSRKMVRDFLTVKGLMVLEAESGQAGLDLALCYRPVAILMDMQLPILSGAEVTLRLRQNPGTRQIPIIAMTASVTAHDRETMQQAGCAAFLPKPIDFDLLWTTLSVFLTEPMPPAGGDIVADTATIEGPAVILVADDEDLNRKIFRDAFAAKGFRMLESATGAETLRVARAEQPDVLLLDVMMPPPDGIEVCRQLKADPATAPIPILMVTAMTERDQRLRGIEAGANDFITKPVDLPEVLLRVRNAVRLKRLYNNLRIANQRLGELQELKDNLTHMIIHDLRSPLTGVLGFLEILQESLRGKLSAQDAECIVSALVGARCLAGMTAALLDVTKLESNAWILKKEEVDLGVLIVEVIRYIGASGAKTTIAFSPPLAPTLVSCDRQLIERVVTNLLSNAVKYAGYEGKVGIAVEDGAAQVTVRVTDSGPGIPPEYHRKIFDKFGAMQLRKEAHHPSVGLGLAFCKLAVEAHGGAIGVESQPGQGSAFHFTIPR